MKPILFLLLCFLSASLLADKLILGGFSYHPLSGYNLNNKHPAIGVEKGGWEAAYVPKNSIGNESFMIAKIALPVNFKGVDFGYRVGLGSGYHYDERLGTLNKLSIGEFAPVAQMVVSKEFQYITIDLGLSGVSTVIFKINL